MNDMNPADFQALATTNPRAALAVALSSLVDVTSTLVTVKLVVGLAQVALVCLGIHMFNRADKRRHAEFMDRHRKSMEASERRHAEAMARIRKDIKASERRHAEAMPRLGRDGKALDALIRRTEGRRGVLSTRHICRRYP
ncbi:MAG: hypothetical protein F4Y02_11715 [Chloroflexi bacterium]|nr:hypothetical protein [Chloroflexota bacterium]